MHNTQVNLQKVQRSASSIFPRLFVLWLHLLVCIMDVSNPKTRKSQQESKKHQKAKGIMSSLLNLHCSKILLFPFFFLVKVLYFLTGENIMSSMGTTPFWKFPRKRFWCELILLGKACSFWGCERGNRIFFCLEKAVRRRRCFMVAWYHVSNEKNLGWFGYIGDYTTQLYRDYNKP